MRVKAMSSQFCATVAICLGIVFPSAHAAPSRATGFLGPLQFTVIDLDLADGIEAGYSFAQGANGPIGQSDTILQAGALSQTVTNEAFQQYVSLTLSAPGATASVTDGGDTVTAEAVASLDGFSAYAAGFSVTGQGPRDNSNPQLFSITLAAHTELIVSATASTFATATDPCPQPIGFYCPSANAQALLHSHTIDGGNDISYILSSAGTNGTPVESQEAVLQVSFVNPNATSTTGWLATRASAQASEVTPVPEPGTYALMLAGMVTCAVLMRGKRR